MLGVVSFLVLSDRDPADPRPFESVAVLPFDDISDGVEEAYFAYGMTDALIAATSSWRRKSSNLVMAAEKFHTLLSANIELAQGLFRMLLEEKKSDPASRARSERRRS